ncbi:MAG: oxidoreductase domain protein [Phycisphaerales bacterium]|nr:oxidoreductase domain protein [Phycisphaerales bacterium]
MATLGWGIIGAGAIAKSFVEGLRSSSTGKLVAVASRAKAKADQFIADNAIAGARSHGSYEALLADPAVQAVYIATPHPQHADWAVKAARAKKHILCEKPIALNNAQAVAIVQAARENNVFLMEAFMYRCHPQTAKLVELIKSNAIGEVRLIQAAFGFAAPFDPKSRLFNNSLGGGGILDVGCYPVSMSRLIAGVALGHDFADPIDVKGMGHIGQTRVDEYATATLRFDRDILATVATAVAVELDNTVRIFGTQGHLFVSEPWVPAKTGGQTEIHLHRTGQALETITIRADRHLYAYEIDAAAEAIRHGRTQAHSPAMSWPDTLGNMKTLDAWRQSFGFAYEAEKNPA